MMKLNTRLLIIVFLTTFPLPIAAEVMDKMPELPAIWIWAGVCSLLGGLAVFIRWWYGMIILPVAVLFSPVGLVLEIRDPSLKHAILREVGTSYLVNVYMAGLLVVAGYVIGGLLHFHRYRTEKRREESTRGE